MMMKTKLSPPWITYVHELKKMFENDNEVSIRYDDENKEVSILVKSIDKANALERVLKHEVEFGNVTLKINVLEPNGNNEDILDIFGKAFAGNPVFEYAIPIESPLGTFRYVVFKNEVAQFFNDQLDDLNGLKSTLYQDMAKDIFNDDLSVNYCTMPKGGNLEKPLGEWP